MEIVFRNQGIVTRTKPNIILFIEVECLSINYINEMGDQRKTVKQITSQNSLFIVV